MSHILVPVDFSINSHNAFRYAVQLANQLQVGIKLLHVYSGSFMPNEPLVFKGANSIEASYENRLKSFAHFDPTDSHPVQQPDIVPISYDAVVDLSVVGTINKHAEEEGTLMILMATTNKTGWLANWLGSTAAKVSETSKAPVLLIPPGATFKPYERIVVANHYDTTDEDILDHLSNWADFFKASLHFVHIVHPKDQSAYQLIAKAVSEHYLADGAAPNFPLEVATIHGPNGVAEGLEDYTEEQDADLLVIVNRSRKMWQALLHKSLTQQMALTSTRPLLIFHATVAV